MMLKSSGVISLSSCANKICAHMGCQQQNHKVSLSTRFILSLHGFCVMPKAKYCSTPSMDGHFVQCGDIPQAIIKNKEKINWPFYKRESISSYSMQHSFSQAYLETCTPLFWHFSELRSIAAQFYKLFFYS